MDKKNTLRPRFKISTALVQKSYEYSNLLRRGLFIFRFGYKKINVFKEKCMFITTSKKLGQVRSICVQGFSYQLHRKILMDLKKNCEYHFKIEMLCQN